MKSEKLSFGLVLAASVGLALGVWFTSRKIYRIWTSVRAKREDYREGTMDELNRVTNFRRQVNKIVADLPAKAHGNRSRAQP